MIKYEKILKIYNEVTNHLTLPIEDIAKICNEIKLIKKCRHCEKYEYFSDTNTMILHDSLGEQCYLKVKSYCENLKQLLEKTKQINMHKT